MRPMQPNAGSGVAGRFVRSAQDPNGPEPEKSAPYFNRGRNISTVLAALVVTYRFILLSIPIDGL